MKNNSQPSVSNTAHSHLLGLAIVLGVTSAFGLAPSTVRTAFAQDTAVSANEDAAALLPAKTIWVAKLTEELQCDRGTRPVLGHAIDQVESTSGVHIDAALISHLKNRAMCMSCSCPAGSFYIAKVKAPTDQQISALEHMDWEVINPQDVPSAPASKPTTPDDYQVLPVSPALK